MKIAILGATGHLSKCAHLVFSQKEDNEITLFSRNGKNINFDNSKSNTTTRSYAEFQDGEYDVIFNGVGSWDTPGANPIEIFEVIENYDNMIMNYQIKHTQTVSIHVSSGAVYAADFQKPVDEHTKAQISVNNYSIGNYYTVAKINSEIKHRAHRELCIVDIRLFGFFSRFMSLEYNYLLSGLIKSVKNDTKFKVIKENFWRDYIHLDDFSDVLNEISKAQHINTAIDIRSKHPISKDELLELFHNKYGLDVDVDNSINISKTGVKPYYYSTVENTVYTPKFSSLETLAHELEFFLGGKSFDK